MQLHVTVLKDKNPLSNKFLGFVEILLVLKNLENIDLLVHNIDCSISRQSQKYSSHTLHPTAKSDSPGTKIFLPEKYKKPENNKDHTKS